MTLAERIEKLENLVRTLVKFAVHDPICEKHKPEAGPHPCTCGLQKVYDQIDAVMS